MKREDFIRQLDETVVRRHGVYAPPERNFGRIAKLWSVYLDDRYGAGAPSKGAPIDLAETDVAIMCGMIKIARLMEDPHHEDSWLDLAGYACCGSEVSETGGAFEQIKKGLEEALNYAGACEQVEANTALTAADFKVGDRVRYRGWKTDYGFEPAPDRIGKTGVVVESGPGGVRVKWPHEKRGYTHDLSIPGLVKLPPDTLDPRNFQIKIGGLYRCKREGKLHLVTGSPPDGPLVSAVPWPSRNPLFSYSYDKDDFLDKFMRVPPAEEAELLKDES